MTRPEQPRPYPGDVRGQAARPAAKPRYRREFRDALNRPLEGQVIFRLAGSDAAVRVSVVGGQLDADLAPGQYTLVGVLTGPDGESVYPRETVTIGRYR